MSKNDAAKRWKLSHPERVKELNKQSYERNKYKIKLYRERHKERQKEYIKKYIETHRIEINTKHKEWRDKNLDKAHLYSKKYASSHKDTVKKKNLRWLKTQKGKLTACRNEDKRRRQLGSNLLNPWFEGCNRHHITKNDIICIPENIHIKYRHTHSKPETMKKINLIAWDFMESSVL